MVSMEDCRRFYADEIRFVANVRSPALVEAFAHVARETYLGPGPWEIASAEIRGVIASGAMQMSYTPVDDPRHLYHNVVVVLDKATDINNGQPSALACWIDAMDLKPGDRAYHLGCGVGYYTAIMAEIVGPGGSVVGIEAHPGLATRAKENLAGYPSVTVYAEDGAAFDPGPCDAMLINAGMTHPIPIWLDRIREGGRMVIPLTMRTTPTLGVGIMAKITHMRGGFSFQIITSVAIYSCTNARDGRYEPLLKTALTTGTLMKVKSLRRDQHEPSDTCVVYGADVCLSSAQL